jgi:D-galactarolactone isomerase
MGSEDRVEQSLGRPCRPMNGRSRRTCELTSKAAPERLVWGSDWPHPGLPDNNKPNDALLFDLLTEWAPDEATRNRILVQNPEVFYGFGKPA